MDILLIIIGSILTLAGLIGCIIPGLPGPPLSYLAVFLLQFSSEKPYTWKFIIIWALITIAITLLDYIIPVLGTKKFGGSQRGMYGSVVGLLLGLFFFPPFGILIGPFLGAFIGELTAGKTTPNALKAGLGSFIGFLTGTALKLVVSGMLLYYFIGAVV